MEGEQTLYIQADTGEYQEYTPPEPPAFHDTLPEGIRESEHLKDVKDAGELATYYVDLKSNYLKPPDTPDGYEFEAPENYDLDEATLTEFKKMAHEAGYNQKQFEVAMKTDVARLQAARKAIDDAHAKHREESEAV